MIKTLTIYETDDKQRHDNIGLANIHQAKLDGDTSIKFLCTVCHGNGIIRMPLLKAPKRNMDFTCQRCDGVGWVVLGY